MPSGAGGDHDKSKRACALYQFYPAMSTPERFRAREVRENIEVYINDEGELYFG